MRLIIPEDSGNAVPLDSSTPGVVRVGLRPDNAAAFAQWFWFRCEDVAGRSLQIRIDTTGCSYPAGFNDYWPVASYDGEDWFRAPTRTEGSELVLDLFPSGDLEIAYFAPYPTSRRAARLARIPHQVLTISPDGLPVAMIELGRGPKPVWFVARQHPGETMGEWFVEGLVDALLGGGPLVERILDRATFRIVPCVNVDGARRGNHRTNARGQDLNRAWSPAGGSGVDPHLAPEVRAIQEAMDRTGVAMALDIHGDEEIPHNFPAGAEGIPAWSEEMAREKTAFVDSWVAATPEFQAVHGYPTTAPGKADLRICTSALAERFRCLSLTIEQPFADHDDAPNPRTGWSPVRCRALGASVLGPIDLALSR